MFYVASSRRGAARAPRVLLEVLSSRRELTRDDTPHVPISSRSGSLLPLQPSPLFDVAEPDFSWSALWTLSFHFPLQGSCQDVVLPFDVTAVL